MMTFLNSFCTFKASIRKCDFFYIVLELFYIVLEQQKKVYFLDQNNFVGIIIISSNKLKQNICLKYIYIINV